MPAQPSYNPERHSSSTPRAPLSISDSDIRGLAVCKIAGSQSLSPSAMCLLRSPDQLMKMLCGFVLICARDSSTGVVQERHRKDKPRRLDGRSFATSASNKLNRQLAYENELGMAGQVIATVRATVMILGPYS